ncbi:hypothetical protein GCM10027601_34620 [Nocardioides ungokensis]
MRLWEENRHHRVAMQPEPGAPHVTARRILALTAAAVLLAGLVVLALKTQVLVRQQWAVRASPADVVVQPQWAA